MSQDLTDALPNGQKTTNPMLEKILEGVDALAASLAELRSEVTELRASGARVEGRVDGLARELREFKTEMRREFFETRINLGQQADQEARNFQSQLNDLTTRVKALEDEGRPQ